MRIYQLSVGTNSLVSMVSVSAINVRWLASASEATLCRSQGRKLKDINSALQTSLITTTSNANYKENVSRWLYLTVFY